MREEARPFQLQLFGADSAAATVAPAAKPTASSSGALAETQLARFFRGRLAAVVWTNNRQRIASLAPAKPGSDLLALRLHRCFRQAPDRLLRQVARWALGRRSTRLAALAELRAYFEAMAPERGQAPRPDSPCRPVGRCFDLREIYAEINERYFGSAVEARISWGQMGLARRRRRTLLLGSFCYQRRLIRIHPRLDHLAVPRWVVASVVYHEMLHAHLPTPEPCARRVLHSAEFRRLESQFAEHEQAQTWLRRNLSALLKEGGLRSE